MASSYTSELRCVSSNANRLFRGYINAYVSSETNTTATIYYEYKVQMKSAAQYGVYIYVYVNGSQKAYKTGYISSSSSSWKDVISSSGSTTITKTASSQSIPVKISVGGTTVSGYGAAYGSGSTSVNVTVAAGKQAPAAATACTLTESTKDTTATFSWTASGTTLQPIESQYWCYKKDNGSWNYTTISNGTTRSATFSLTTNARYQAAVRMQNSVGNSSWIYSDYIYTKPAAPSAVVGMNTGTYVNLTATNASATWYASNVWQVSLDGGSTYSTISGQTGATLKYTIDTSSTDTNVLEPRFRCAIKNTEGDQSDWTYCIPTKQISVYVWCPEGETISGIYINDGAVT